jgi:hypothetical protein
MLRIRTIAFYSLFVFIISSGLGATALAQDNPFAPEPAPKLPPGMTGSNSSDPRAKLKPGMYDAGETAMGLRHVTLVRKPDAFALPNDPTDPKVDKTIGQLGMGDPTKVPPALKLVLAGLGFANSDLAFQGDRLFLGNFYGMNIYDISDAAKVRLLTSIICPGGQGDVSVYKNLMFMSVEMQNGRLDCGTEGFPVQTQPGLPAASKDRFRGVRIFDISDIRNPRQIAAVQTCRGSHTHTLVTDPKDKNNVYIYVSGTSFVRQAEELPGCSGGPPAKDANTALFRIDIIKVPLRKPQDAKVINSPRIFMDPRSGEIAGLTSAKTHGVGDPQPTDQCHDITVYSALGLAAGACSGNGILLDITDPANPKRIDAVNDPNYAYWHSATFSNDGKKVVFTDEWGGGLGARCRENDPNVWGANSIFTIESGNRLKFMSYYKLPAAQGDTENCVAHNGSIIPVPGRDIMVQAWYQGGISVMDFTDVRNPKEIAYFDRGPITPDVLVLGGSWSAYWYNGHIYSSEISRGLDVLELVPSNFLTQNEIDAAKSVKYADLNVQSQQKIVWPKNKAAAMAYVDQLERSDSLSTAQIVSLREAIEKAAARRDNSTLATLATALEKDAIAAKDRIAAKRMTALADVLRNGEF